MFATALIFLDYILYYNFGTVFDLFSEGVTDIVEYFLLLYQTDAHARPRETR